MQGTELRTIERKTRRPRTPWIISAAAMLIAVVAIGALIFTMGGSDDAATEPTAPVTTTRAIATDEAAIDVVLASVAARNNGDIDAWMATLGGEELSGVVAYPDLFESYFAAKSNVTILEPCKVIGVGLIGETIVQCETSYSDDFLGAGGVLERGASLFYVLDSKVERWEDGMVTNDPGDFTSQFWAWFHDTHPDEARAVGAPSDIRALETADGMTTALQYVDEFVAQSDAYPIGG